MTEQSTPRGTPDRPPDGPSEEPDRWANVVRRFVAGAIGAWLGIFGVLALRSGLPFLAATDRTVLGLSADGLLAVTSLVAAVILLGSAVHRGQAGSTVTVAMGVLFLVSGIGHFLVLDTQWNIFAFSLPTVMFSLTTGLVLLAVGMYGRFGGGGTQWNPYAPPARTSAANLGTTPVRPGPNGSSSTTTRQPPN